MTPSQEKAVERIRKQLAPRDGYEFKRNKIDTRGRLVFLTLETGLIDDEGTMASIFARDTRMFMIGPRGSISTHTDGQWKKGFRVWAIVKY